MIHKLLAALMAFLLIFSAVSALAADDYTVAEKFLLQVKAGSGVSGTLSADVLSPSGESLWKQPLTLEGSYIQVPGTPTDCRLELNLMKDGQSVSAMNLQALGSQIRFQADVLSPDWYTLSNNPAKWPVTSESDPREALSASAPTLTELALKLVTLVGADFPEALTEDLTTQLDIWLEAYRDEPVMSNGNIDIYYSVPASALKTEVKILLSQILDNRAYLDILQAALGEDAALYVNPDYLQYYYAAIDALPLKGSLSLDRRLTTKGTTDSLTLELPLYDTAAGDVMLRYERQAPGEMEPQQEKLTLDAGKTLCTLAWSCTPAENNANVYAGSLICQKEDGESSLSFSLTAGEETVFLDSGEESYTFTGALSLVPGTEKSLIEQGLDAELSANFTGATSKKAATQMNATLKLTPTGENSLVISLSARTRAKWQVDELNITPTDISSLSLSETALLLASLTKNLSGIIEDYAK